MVCIWKDREGLCVCVCGGGWLVPHPDSKTYGSSCVGAEALSED